MSEQPPQEFEALKEAYSKKYSTLSKRLRQIADFAIEHPTTMALETIANISRSAEVQPSAVIRFAKAFGYTGFSQLQRVYQEHVATQSASYAERVSKELSDRDSVQPESPLGLLRQYCKANIVTLEHLQHGIDSGSLTDAVNLIANAKVIYVMAQRRSFPIATYLAYLLSRADRRVYLLDGIGGLLTEQAQSMAKEDLLIAISFHSYSPETVNIVSIARREKVPHIAISDSSLSPIVEGAKVAFSVHDAEVHSFRSLSASMCLAQTLATSLAFRMKKPKSKRRKIKRKTAPRKAGSG